MSAVRSGTGSAAGAPANGAANTNGAAGDADVLVLPRFKKNQRVLDHNDHSWCCCLSPPGVFEGDVDRKIKRNAAGVFGVAAVQMGGRDHMEDRHRIHYSTSPNSHYKAFFAVFDGHGGEESAHLSCKNLHLIIEAVANDVQAGIPVAQAGASMFHAQDSSTHTSSSSSVSSSTAISLSGKSGEGAPNGSGAFDWRSILTRSCDILEAEALRLSREVGCRDGTTVSACLITDTDIYCCNIGDSRSVLCRDGSAVPLSEDHKPSHPSERQRIIDAGGSVRAVMADRSGFCCFAAKKVPQGAERLWPGGFSVSRAIGDIDYKDIRRRKTNLIGVLSHKPDITVTSINKSQDQFIVIGSDGLWDVLTNQQACEIITKELRKKKYEQQLLARKLADKAFSLGSEDNISAVVILFTNHDCINNVK